jgi:serine protease Do
MLFTRVWIGVTSILFCVSPNLFSADKSDSFEWDSRRVTSPESVDELKALQSKVKKVHAQVAPTTVGLLLGNDPNARGLSCGSGVIINDEGLVLTAAHVIGKPREPIVFVLPDGRKVSGVSLGMNSVADSGMALITEKPPKDYPGVKDGKWPFAKTGTSADLQKGQWIVSLGHPGGPKPDRPPPVRTGRFLGVEKAGRFQRNDLLNTDATLVGGDSGGPLFDLSGKVIGIHSEIGETLESNRHVPMDKFKDEWDRMARGDIIFRTEKERDRNTKVGLNIYFGDKVDTTQSARLVKVEADGVADKAGMEAGDVIVRFNNYPVKSIDDLRNMLPSYRVGEKIKVDLLREDATFTVQVKLGEKQR